ncbi:MAG: amidohydrolase family protein [Saprospiraceae bacterium]|uniref:Amidohydrolase family protein n=1 Tax=Candidatus Opimibacter skivensis TaxID=2982028 RepID=A0A9D7SUF9_9BACT|nr:amidohydrolase family protein [Candidatus Opimibacter skivensis]
MYKLKFTFLLILLTNVSILLSQNFSDNVKPFIAIKETVFAITNVTVVDGTGGAPQNNMTVMVKNGKISYVGPSDKISIAKGTFTIDGAGQTLIPGFVMLHEHMFYTKPFEDEFNIVNMTNTFPRMYLAGGATSIRTGGSVSPFTDLNINKLIKEGKMIGPKMDVTGPFIERENNFSIPQLPILPAGQAPGPMVDYWANLGCTSFKAYMNLSREDLKETLEHAHARGMKVTGHLCSISYHEAAELGIDDLEHGFMVCSDFNKDRTEDHCDYRKAWSGLMALDKDAPAMDSLMKFLIKKDVAVTTTLPVFAPLKNYELIPGGGEQALHPDILEEVKKYSAGDAKSDSIDNIMFTKELYWIKKFFHLGGKLVVGTDPTGSGRTIAGYANIWTLETLIKSGFTTSEAVMLCSLKGAEYLRKQFDTGSIEKGKAADLILMDGNLTIDPGSIRHIRYVFKDGIGYDSKAIFDSVKGKVGLY